MLAGKFANFNDNLNVSRLAVKHSLNSRNVMYGRLVRLSTMSLKSVSIILEKLNSISLKQY